MQSTKGATVPKHSASQYYKNLPPGKAPPPKAPVEYFFNDEKEGKPYDDIEEGKKRVRGMLDSFIKFIMKDEVAAHQYRGNPNMVNIPITSELYDKVRFTGYKYTKDGYTATINGNVNVQVSNDDITKEDTDIIVSVTNSQLNHNNGLANAIRKAGAGKTVQQECAEYVTEKGPVMTGNVVLTSAGDLPAKKIIHAVGPVHE